VLNAAKTTHVQEVLGTFLYYARAVDNTMLAAIGSIATQQANATEATMKAIVERNLFVRFPHCCFVTIV
jgi:hypothetical protein